MTEQPVTPTDAPDELIPSPEERPERPSPDRRDDVPPDDEEDGE